jgi:hypothetical protein
MTDTSVLVAIEAANASRSACLCGQSLDLSDHGGAIWLECPTLTAPSRLPAALSSFLRELAHDRSFVVELPEASDAEPALVNVGTPVARRRVAVTA